jgi:hypothetical protein
MRSLASALLVIAALGPGAPALAAESMSAHQAPASMPAGAGAVRAPALPAKPMLADRRPASMPAGDAHRDDGDRHHRHHRHGFLLPFGFFEQVPAQQVVVAQPDASSLPAPPTSPTDAADRPPCREISAGVVILRGTGCTR